jgi:hypothetical protein
MKSPILRIVYAIAGTALLAISVSAQRDAISAAAGDKYVISAKAGGVNFVSGRVGVVREGGSGYLLKGDALDIGDRVSTGSDGKAEILMNPGSYLRLGPNSAFEFKTTDLDDLQISLDAGSAIFEVFATPDFVVTVNTPKTKLALIDSGIYRIDVAANGIGTVSVWKGKAQVGDDAAAIVKSGREATENGGEVAITKFDRGDKDEFETWSKDRAKELAKVTARLPRTNVRTALMRSFLGRQWNMYNSFGLWVYDPFTRSNCFLPFGWGWGSPYGYGFGNSIGYYNLPVVVYSPPSNGPGSNGGVREVKRHREPPVDGFSPPPFVRAQGSSNATGREVMETKRGRGGDFEPSFGSDAIRSSGGFPASSAPAAPPAAEVKIGRRP